MRARMFAQLDRDVSETLTTAPGSSPAAPPLTFGDVAAAVASIPPPPTYTARPEWVGRLLALLRPTDDPRGPAAYGPSIKEDPGLPVRWLLSSGRGLIFESLDGQCYRHEAPDPLALPPLPEPGFRPEDFRVRIASPLRARVPMPSMYLWDMGGGPRRSPPPKPRRKRASKGRRKHVRRQKAHARRTTPTPTRTP